MTASKLPRRIFIIQAAAGMAILVQGCSRPDAPAPGPSATTAPAGPSPGQPATNAAQATPPAHASTQTSAATTQSAIVSADSPAGFVSESDATAIALGFKTDAANVDAKSYPTYAAGQKCSSCSQFLGKEGAESAKCGIFPGKNVYAKSWCAAYSKKPA